MTVQSTAVWRVRPSGNNTNGGGLDCSLSPAATGTNGALSGVTFTDTVAAAFTSGMAGSAINISGVGQFKIATFISATQITLGVGANGVLPQLPNGGATWTVSAGADYSQQDSAQLSVTDAACTTGGSTVTSATGGFTAAMVGNAMYLSGTNFTTGFYFITARTNTNTVTVDRDPTNGSNASAGTCHVGGGWADPFTNTASSTTLKPGNYVYILGSGIPAPASYTYDYTFTTSVNLAPGDGTTGPVTCACDQLTPNYKPYPDTTGGMPVILNNGGTIGSTSHFIKWVTIWFVNKTNGNFVSNNNNGTSWLGCVCDTFNVDCGFVGDSAMLAIGCEVFSSVPVSTIGSAPAFSAFSGGVWIGNNIHDLRQNGINAIATNYVALNNIIAKCLGDGFTGGSNGGPTVIVGNTVDGNGGHGIIINAIVSDIICMNNIISNHTTAGKFGLKFGSGTTAANDLMKRLTDYNVFFNNNANLSAISFALHDTAGISDPYVTQVTENYTLR